VDEVALFYRKERSMATTNTAVRRFIADENGAALAEYGILIAFIAIVAIVAVTFFGSKISSKFSEYANKL
jgi:pilus assembly protein Flp/PilA